MTLKTSFNRAFACLCSCAITLFTCLFSFVPSVYAVELPSTGSAVGDWITSSAVDAGWSALETAVLQNFSSYDQTTIKILEAEIGFCGALYQDIYASENGVEDFTIGGTTFSALSGVCYIPVDGVNELCVCYATFSPSGVMIRSSHGVYACVRGYTGTSPWLSWSGSTCVYHLTGSSSNRFVMYSGSFFDNPTPYTTPYFTNMACNFTWSTSGNPPVITSNTWVYYNSSYYSNCNNFLRTDIEPISMDTSSDDVPTIMAAYKSSLASQLGITVEDVDVVWTLPDEIPEDPTEPDGSGCCCQLFTLPSEWVQSDVVELETDHYTVPYDDMIEEPFDYLAGLGTYPNPPTPALNARKRSETSTATRAVSVDEGSPPLIWDLADYETKTALTDYFLFAENLLHDTGLYNLVGSLIAVGIIVSLV